MTPPLTATNGGVMNQIQLENRALRAEVNRLSEKLSAHAHANAQMALVEKLICAALSGVSASGSSPADCAKFALECSDEVLKRIANVQDEPANESENTEHA